MKRNTEKDGLVSVLQLHKETGCHRASIKKWIIEAGLVPTDGKYDSAEALRVIAERSEGVEVGKESQFVRLARARAELAEIDVRIKKRLEAETYMETDGVERLVILTVSNLEAIPSKMESEFGWEPRITKRLTALIDEARHEIAKGIKEINNAKK